jgi:excinuclease ABC subunit A
MSASIANGNGQITIRGARTHNLKNIDLTLPKQTLIVITGVSGSGKSSLAFDTVYAEGQRRYVESLSAYARQFLERMQKPDVDEIDGICPAIAIRQKNSIRNPRSTVGTTTEIHDYLRLLYARIGRTICRGCGKAVFRDSAEVAARRLAALSDGTRLLIGFEMPVVDTAAILDDGSGHDDTRVNESERTEHWPTSPVGKVFDGLHRKGFRRVVVGGQAMSLEEIDLTVLEEEATIRVVVDRVKIGSENLSRITDSVETAYLEGGGKSFAIEVEPTVNPSTGAARNPALVDPTVHLFSELFECGDCGIQYEVPQPRLFSFNNPFGACPTCHGFGNVIELDLDLVVPDQTKSVNQDAIEPWSKPYYRSHLAGLKKAARNRGIRMNVPWAELTEDERRFVVEGDEADYLGIKGFFRRLERKKYKVHVRVFLSRYRGYVVCPECEGTRLCREARDVRVGDQTIDFLCSLTVARARQFLDELDLTQKDAAIAERIIREIRRRLTFLNDVGLEYLTLDRLSSTLSGGEAQRINLATSLGSALVGTLYVLDEPSIGLHPRDNERLMRILRELRDQGNTVIVVEHDADIIRTGDYLVDLGLGAGTRGGKVVYAGPYERLKDERTSLTAKYLRGELAIPLPTTRRKRLPQSQALRLVGATEHNLKSVDVEIPINMLTCVTGVSGSGKSTLVHDVLYAAIKKAKGEWDKRVGSHERLDGLELVSNVVLVDQAPIGRTPRSNPVTYLKAFDPIRGLFASTKEAQANGLKAGHFSFNVPGGRCDACEGEGEVRVEMQFLADVFLPCEHCDGQRFKPEVLSVQYRGRRINEVLEMTVREALAFFGTVPKVVRRLQVLDEIGLGYVRLGQPATTLSGGEAQRIKIASHLTSHSRNRTLYILDEPTTGLHFDDIAKLLTAFQKLLQAEHTLVVIEHNLDVIKTADWVIDLGPEGGDAGGRLMVAGPPETVAANTESHTGRYLRPVLAAGRTHAYADS